jgi:sucrose-6-phosphate hydrolase SacC (GH32 family)
MNFRELRLAPARDRHRPLYHFVAPANWMNDPNGAFFGRTSITCFTKPTAFGQYEKKWLVLIRSPSAWF